MFEASMTDFESAGVLGIFSGCMNTLANSGTYMRDEVQQRNER